MASEKTAYLRALMGGAGIVGQVAVRDERHGLALVRLNGLLPFQVESLPLAQASAKEGDRIHALGNPPASNALWVYTTGTVRQVYQKQWMLRGSGGSTITMDARVLETQSPVNLGDSGGPVVNDRAELVGVTVGERTAAQFMNIFIDVSEVRSLLAKYRKDTGTKP